jgi:hypothetical protein
MMKKIAYLAIIMTFTSATTSYCELRMRTTAERNKLENNSKARVDATKEIITILEENLTEEQTEAYNLKELIKYLVENPDSNQKTLGRYRAELKSSKEIIKYHKNALKEENELLQKLDQSENQYGIRYLD